MALFSVVVPTRNEDARLSLLLKSVRWQGYAAEVLIGDYESTDKTRDIAEESGARFVEVRRRGPAAGRNTAARLATGAILVFVDADTVLPRNFLRDAEYVMRPNVGDLDIAVPRLWPLEGTLKEWLAYGSANAASKVLSLIKPHGAGVCILCRAWLFRAIGGFDESLTFGEDVDFIERASRLGRFGRLHGLHVFTSPRRLRNEGFWRLAWLYTRYALPGTDRASVGGYWA